MLTIDLIKAVESSPARSAWAKGVKLYALELLEDFQEDEFLGSPADRKALLNGASSWEQYSEGGCSLIYDYTIAERLCNPTELKRTKGGELPPNRSENWIDCQTRALRKAYWLIMTVSGKAV